MLRTGTKIGARLLVYVWKYAPLRQVAQIHEPRVAIVPGSNRMMSHAFFRRLHQVR